MKKVSLIVLLLCITFMLSAQTPEEPNPMLVGILKKQLKDWKEHPPETKPDELLPGAPFVPVNGKYDGAGVLEKYIDSIIANIKVGTGGASLYETENGELRLDYISLDYKWSALPGWKDVSVVPLITSVKDVKGGELIMSPEIYQQYLEQRYFEDAFYQGPSGGYGEMKVYLGRNVTFDDYPAEMTGELQVNFPTEYEASTFTIADTGKTRKMGEYDFTLLSMDRNTVMYRVQGKRGFNDAYEKLCTNKNGRTFNGRKGNSCPYAFYMTAMKNKFELPDAELNKFALEVMKNADSGTVDDIHIVRVEGTISAITFYTIKAYGQKIVPLKLTAQ